MSWIGNVEIMAIQALDSRAFTTHTRNLNLELNSENSEVRTLDSEVIWTFGAKISVVQPPHDESLIQSVESKIQNSWKIFVEFF